MCQPGSVPATSLIDIITVLSLSFISAQLCLPCDELADHEHVVSAHHQLSHVALLLGILKCLCKLQGIAQAHIIIDRTTTNVHD